MKLTETEKNLLLTTEERYKYIARDENGDLYLYTKKPIKALHLYDIPDDESDFQYFDVPNHLFPDIKWEDKEPYKFR